MKFIIMDVSVVRMNAKMVLEEGLFLVDLDKDVWSKNFQDAKNFSSVDEAVGTAKSIMPFFSKPPRVFGIVQNAMNINITEYKY